jgi:hypothetical protein
MPIPTTTAKPIAATSTVGIHSGAVTHHHDHPDTTVTSSSFKVRNRMNSIPQRPVPLDELDETDFDM